MEGGGRKAESNHICNESINHTYIMNILDTKTSVNFLAITLHIATYQYAGRRANPDIMGRTHQKLHMWGHPRLQFMSLFYGLVLIYIFFCYNKTLFVSIIVSWVLESLYWNTKPEEVVGTFEFTSTLSELWVASEPQACSWVSQVMIILWRAMSKTKSRVWFNSG